MDLSIDYWLSVASCMMQRPHSRWLCAFSGHSDTEWAVMNLPLRVGGSAFVWSSGLNQSHIYGLDAGTVIFNPLTAIPERIIICNIHKELTNGGSSWGNIERIELDLNSSGSGPPPQYVSSSHCTAIAHIFELKIMRAGN
jgi:hypothetical protein